ncbi:MAG: hypothetical protein J6I83_03215 [Firmicutes bacterium]|nr:hypothetical protein [Bacillota bacterium]
MTYSIVDIIDMFDESAVEELIWEEEKPETISFERVKALVHDGICGNSSYNKKRDNIRVKGAWRLRLIAALVALAVAAVPCYALIGGKLSRSAVINDGNKYFVGSQVDDDYYIIIDEDGNYRDSHGNEGSLEDIISKNELHKDSEKVKEIEDNVLNPASYVEIAGEKGSDGSVRYPAIILINNSVCILTNNAGDGWNLDKGESLKVKIIKEDAGSARKRNMIVGYIQDGVLKKGEALNSDECECVFTAEVAGEYYIYLLSASSDYLTLEGLNIISLN